jgi:quercetin dioxygenase-like cupin family protein
MSTKTMRLAALAVIGSVAIADTPHEVRISRASDNPAMQAPATNFTGTVSLQSQFRGDAPARVAGAIVNFERGARTNWHTHPLGQTLIVTRGSGFVQSWGGTRQTITVGDVAWIPPETKHWHGATESTSMSHVAITEALDGKTVEWMEKVTDTQYGAK